MPKTEDRGTRSFFPRKRDTLPALSWSISTSQTVEVMTVAVVRPRTSNSSSKRNESSGRKLVFPSRPKLPESRCPFFIESFRARSLTGWRPGQRDLTFNNHRRSDVHRAIKLPRSPVGHPNTAVRGRFTGQIPGMQSVAGRKFDVERHRRADKVRTSRPRVPADIDVRPNNLAVRVHVIAIEARAMVLI